MPNSECWPRKSCNSGKASRPVLELCWERNFHVRDLVLEVSAFGDEEGLEISLCDPIGNKEPCLFPTELTSCNRSFLVFPCLGEGGPGLLGSTSHFV